MFGLFTKDELGPLEGESESWARRDPFSRHLPYRAFDEETDEYHNLDNTVGRLWECRPVTFMSEKCREALTNMFRQEYEAETIFQFTLCPDLNITPIIGEYLKLKTRDDELVQEAGTRYAKHLLDGTRGLKRMAGIPVRNFRLVVSIKSPKRLPAERLASIEEALRNSGFAPRRMKPADLLALLRPMFNKQVPSHPGSYNPGKYISSQLIGADNPVEEIEGGMKVGGRMAACLTPKSMPDLVDALKTISLIGGYMGPEDDVTQLMHSFLWTTTVFMRTSKKSVSLKSNTMMMQRVGGGLAKSLGRRVKELDWVLDDMENVPYCDVIMSMWVFGEDADDLNKGLARARGLWEKQGFVMQRETQIQKAMLIASLPFGLYTGGAKMSNIDTLDRHFPVNLVAAASLLPVQGDFSGGMKPILLLVGRKGQIASIDVFDKGANNHNFLVCAGSGAGKSFTLNNFVNNYFASNAIVRLVDIGYSYKKQAAAVRGRFIDIGDRSLKICLNPFSSAGDKKDREGNDAAAANIILTMVYSNTGTAQVTETHVTLMKDAVAYARSVDDGERGVDHCYEFLSTYPKHAGEVGYEGAVNLAHEMAFNMRSWCGKGPYASMVNGKSTLNFSSDEFVVLEMEQLLSVPELFRVFSMMTLNAVTLDLYLSDRSRQRFMLFDEAWKYLGADDKTPTAPGRMIGGIIVEGYRRARKYNGSTGIVTQSPLDLQRFGDAGGVIRSQSAFKVWAYADDYKDAIRAGVLDYQGLAQQLILSIRNNKPNYGEVVWDTPYGMGCGRLCVDPWNYWVATTDGAEVAKYEMCVDQGMTPRQAIDHLAGVK